MKRKNIYLYEYNGDARGRCVGFCKMDLSNNVAKLTLNINNDMLGIEKEQLVEIQSEILMEGGDVRLFQGFNSVSVDNVPEKQLVGVSVIFQKKNGIKNKVIGLLDGKSFEPKQVKAAEVKENNRIRQIELEDTVYNVDMECLKEKKPREYKKLNKHTVKVAGVDRELVMFALEDITDLPREYWHLSKNKFVVCGCNRYGHLAYIQKDNRYIICVPGVISEKICGCARRYGFKSFFLVEEEDKESQMGYWVLNSKF